ncbi:MAG TPA: MBL fold metallo-hydrolase [Bryobacterales bacterium]|nr:MBL fold metallo-hydrolase [Bryobacterales bacterium]
MHTHHNRDRHDCSRRGFLGRLLASTLPGASVLELSIARAACARAQAAGANPQLFDIGKITSGVYAAIARPAVLTNCNAVIFERSADLLVVDTHSKPSAVASLVAQIRREVSPKPVRYVVNTHFHYDHTQGNPEYQKQFSKLDIVASETTKKLMVELAEKRLKASLDAIPASIAQAEEKAAKTRSAEERAFFEDEARQYRAYLAEMKDYRVALPTITFAESYVIKDKAGDIHLSFHGRAHTASDIVVFSPVKKVLAAGDLIHGSFPTITDGYPREWPATLDAVAKIGFTYAAPGHGPVQKGAARIRNMRNYIEELAARVADGKRAGKSVAELQKTITVSSLRSLAADGYADYILANRSAGYRRLGPIRMQDGIDGNIAQIYEALEHR